MTIAGCGKLIRSIHCIDDVMVPMLVACMRVVIRLIAMGLALLPAPAGAGDAAFNPARFLSESDISETHQLLRKTLPGEPLMLEDARRIRFSIVLSAIGQKCGLDWAQRIYLPLMAYYRHTRHFTEEQMTFLGVMHGTQQYAVYSKLSGDCPPQIRARYPRLLP